MQVCINLWIPSAEAALGGIFLEAGLSMQDPPSPVDVCTVSVSVHSNPI